MNGVIGEIRGFGGNFAPRAWSFCQGQLLAISSNTALFSILGTTYGGDGRTTFALPDLRGRIPLSEGTGPGLTTQRLGNRSGQEDVIVNTLSMPSHHHAAATSNAMSATLVSTAKDGEATSDVPVAGLSVAKGNTEINFASTPTKLYSGAGSSVTLSSGTSTIAQGQPVAFGLKGGTQEHNNLQPYLVTNWIICFQGIFPSRS